MPMPDPARVSKTPSAARRVTFQMLLSALCLAPVATAQTTEPTAQTTEPTAQTTPTAPGEVGTPLSEADVIRLALTRTPTAVVATATEALADARTRTAAPLANPQLNWHRETVQSGPSGSQGAEDTLSASIPIDLVRRRATRALVASEGAWLHAEASLSRTTAVLDAVLAYYDLVIAERRVEVLAQAVSNLDEAARVLQRREEAGNASGYESSRLAIASELIRSHLAEARGTHQGARARLAALLGIPTESLRSDGTLALVSSADGSALAQTRGESRPALQQARESLRLAGEAGEHAEWAWLPALEIEGGVKRASDAGAASGYGYVVGVSLSLPVFDHGQAEQEQARAQQTLATARSEALARTFDADAQSALVTFRAASQELSRFDAQTAGHVDALLRAAQSGYREGERTIVELLDAQRAQTEVAERRLALLQEAKRAEARLRAAAGELQ